MDDILWELTSVITTEIPAYKRLLARFENYAEYFECDDSDKLFQLRASLVGAAAQILWDAGKQSTVSRTVSLLKARFGSDNHAERFHAELRSRKRYTIDQHFRNVLHRRYRLDRWLAVQFIHKQLFLSVNAHTPYVHDIIRSSLLLICFY